MEHLANVIAQAIQHRGYALVDVLQPCVTFNRANDYDFYRPRIYKVDEEPWYDPTDRVAAFRRGLEWGERIPIGVLYQTEERPAYEEQMPALQAGPLARQGFRSWGQADYEESIGEYL